MQRMMGLMRRCIDDYRMIEPNDKIAVGVSGGKDSLTLLTLLAALREYYPEPYDLTAITIDMGLPGMDFSPVEDYCAKLGVPFQRVPTQIGPIIFEYRKEKNPCSMCAKMRRGALNQALLAQGFHKVALGHHYDDAVETFLMLPACDQSRSHRRDPDSPHALSDRGNGAQLCRIAAASYHS